MKHLYMVVVASLVLLLTGCVSSASTPHDPSQASLLITDSTAANVYVDKNPKNVVVLSASLAELWLASGGDLAGTTSDFFEEGRIETPDSNGSYSLSGIQNVGTVKDPSAELILSLSPELVILSPAISGHKTAAVVLDEAGVPVYFADADSFEDYLEVLKDFTDLTSRNDLYTSLGDDQRASVENLIRSMPNGEKPTVLVLRAFSSGVKAKAEGTVLTNILSDLGVVNIASGDAALTENLSLEKVVEEDPDYILIVYMGAETEETDQYLRNNLYSDPVWSALTAVRLGNVHILPQDLFHYKPNERWEAAYAYLLEIFR